MWTSETLEFFSIQFLATFAPCGFFTIYPKYILKNNSFIDEKLFYLFVHYKITGFGVVGFYVFRHYVIVTTKHKASPGHTALWLPSQTFPPLVFLDCLLLNSISICFLTLLCLSLLSSCLCPGNLALISTICLGMASSAHWPRVFHQLSSFGGSLHMFCRNNLSMSLVHLSHHSQKSVSDICWHSSPSFSVLGKLYQSGWVGTLSWEWEKFRICPQEHSNFLSFLSSLSLSLSLPPPFFLQILAYEDGR